MNNRIKELRKEQKLTVKDLADYIGVSQSMLSNYENGNSTPRDNETWHKLSEYLNADIGYIMGVSDIRNIDDITFSTSNQSANEFDLDKTLLKNNLNFLLDKNIDDLVLEDKTFINWLQGIIFTYQTLKDSKEELKHFDDILKNAIDIVSFGHHLNENENENLVLKSYQAKDAAINAIQKVFDDQTK